jgi:hypothetical protein
MLLYILLICLFLWLYKNDIDNFVDTNISEHYKKKHIAVLIYGRLNKCVEHYNNIIESLGKNNDIDFFLSSDNSSETLINDFINLYKPILYNNNQIHYDYDLSIYPNKRDETNLHSMTCHFINKNRVFLLLEEHINKNNVHYDCVVSLRIDAVFTNNFIFNFNSLEDNTIYIPYGNDFLDKGINDQIAYGKINVMKKYNSMNPVDLLEKQLSIPHPESLNYANIHFNKLNIERPNIEYYLDR